HAAPADHGGPLRAAAAFLCAGGPRRLPGQRRPHRPASTPGWDELLSHLSGWLRQRQSDRSEQSSVTLSGLGPPGRNAAGYDRRFAVSDLEALLRSGDTGSLALTSDLLRLCPDSFADPRSRRLVTMLSNDPDRPGVAPWVW